MFAGLGAIPFFVHNPPPQPGLAGEFNGIFYQSHWAQFVAFAQVVAGLLLLANRYVPVALIIVAEFLYNSYAFHITMLPIALAAPIVATILWLLVAFNIATSSPRSSARDPPSLLRFCRITQERRARITSGSMRTRGAGARRFDEFRSAGRRLQNRRRRHGRSR